ncbi:hypothetical protein SGLAM104S_05125 [Streptomyces glaucescens]
MGCSSVSLNPMSFRPSSTTSVSRPGWSRTSRPSRWTAFSPNHAESLSSRFPPIPALATGRPVRRASASDQRRSVPGVEPKPSVMESPKRAIPSVRPASVSTAERKYQDSVVSVNPVPPVSASRSPAPR